MHEITSSTVHGNWWVFQKTVGGILKLFSFIQLTSPSLAPPASMLRLRPGLCEVLLKWPMYMMVMCPAWSRQLLDDRETLSANRGGGNRCDLGVKSQVGS